MADMKATGNEFFSGKPFAITDKYWTADAPVTYDEYKAEAKRVAAAAGVREKDESSGHLNPTVLKVFNRELDKLAQTGVAKHEVLGKWFENQQITPKQEEAAADRAAADAKTQAAADAKALEPRGRRGTLLTGWRGLLTKATTRRKTLLGQ